MPHNVEMTTELTPRDEIFMHLTIVELMGASMGVGCGLLIFVQHALPLWLRISGGLTLSLLSIGFVTIKVRGHNLLGWSSLVMEHFMWPRQSVWTPEMEEAPEEEVVTDDVSQMLSRMGGTTAPPAPEKAPKTRVNQKKKKRGGPAKTQLLPLVPSLIADRMVTMPDGHRCGALECTGRNLPMLADSELDQWDARYHRFLLSLTHPIKIVRRVRPAKVGPYLETRRARARRLPNPSLRAIERYDLNFMESMATTSTGGSATTPRTFVIIPAPETIADSAGPSHGFKAILGRKSEPDIAPDHAQAAMALDQRCNAIIDQLLRLGIFARRLDEQDLAEMWHETLRPRMSAMQPLPSDAVASSGASVGQIGRAETAAPQFVV